MIMNMILWMIHDSVEKTVVSTAYDKSNSNSNKTNFAKPSSSLDNVLDTIKGPKVVSTVSKSSMDWDSYKDKEGLTDELSKAAKEG